MIAIAAIGPSRVIGSHGKMPWHLPRDLEFFRKTTTGHIVLMGRKTYEAIGHPLPQRETWVLTRDACDTLPSGVRRIADAAQITEPTDGRKLFLVGGAQIYAALLPRCTELLLTHVHGDFTGDAFFPPYEKFFQRVETLYDDEQMTIARYVPAKAHV